VLSVYVATKNCIFNLIINAGSNKMHYRPIKVKISSCSILDPSDFLLSGSDRGIEPIIRSDVVWIRQRRHL